MRDLSDKMAPLRKLQSQQRRQQSATPLRNATVSGGDTRWIGLLSILVEGSGLVTGLWDVDGELRVGGTFTGAGTMVFDGTSTFNGPITVVGAWTFTGNGTITGNVGLTGNLTIGTGGKITAGGLTITPTGELSSTSNLVITAPTTRFESAVTVAGGKATTLGGTLNAQATATFGSDVFFSSLPTKLGTTLTPNLPAGTLWRDPANGRLTRIT